MERGELEGDRDRWRYRQADRVNVLQSARFHDRFLERRTERVKDKRQREREREIGRK